MRTILTLNILFFFCSFSLTAQNIEGIWVSGYSEISKVTQNEKGNLIKNEDGTLKYFTDFELSYSIIDFTSKRKVKFVGLGGQITKGRYSVSKGKLKLSVNFRKISGTYSNNEIILITKRKSGESVKMYFQRVTPSTLKMPINNNDSIFNESSWRMDSDKKYPFIPSQYHISERGRIGRVAIVFTKNGGIDHDEVNTLIYKNHLFLFNTLGLRKYCFHFYGTENSKLLSEVFAFNMAESSSQLPDLVKVKFEKEKILSAKQISSLKENLYGKWKDTNSPFVYDVSLFESVENQFFEINFNKDGTFLISESASFEWGGNTNSTKVSYSGNWVLNNTGNYLTLQTDGKKSIIIIEKLSSNSLHINLRSSLNPRLYPVTISAKLKKVKS